MNNEDKILSILETLVGKVDIMETRFDTFEAKVDKLEHDLQEVKSEVQEVKLEVQEVKLEVQEVKHRTIVIENDYGKRIDAALDGYSALYDISNEIRSDIRKIYDQQDRQDAYITVLESERRKLK